MARVDRASIRFHQAASPQDALLLAKLAHDIWTEHYVPIIGAGQVVYMLERFQSSEQIYQDFRQNGYIYIWLSAEGWPVAYMAWQAQSVDICFLSKLYVRKAYRGQGLARLMLDHLVRYCRVHKLRKIWLTVNKQNRHSIEVYKKMMFIVADAVITDIGNGYVMDDYVMQRDLV